MQLHKWRANSMQKNAKGAVWWWARSDNWRESGPEIGGFVCCPSCTDSHSCDDDPTEHIWGKCKCHFVKTYAWFRMRSGEPHSCHKSYKSYPMVLIFSQSNKKHRSDWRNKSTRKLYTKSSEADSFQRNNERATRQSGQDLHKARIFPCVSFITKQESEGELLSRKVGCHADSVSRLPKW